MASDGVRSPASSSPNGGPHQPRYQILGEIPAIVPDVPVNVVFLLLFTATFAAYSTLFLRNRSEGKKFPITLLIIAFCATRIIATSLRMAWACNPSDIQIEIAALIFLYAGIVFLFVANLFFAQRVVRAQHPRFGWSKPFSLLLPILIAITIATLICLIVAIVVQFYTLRPTSLKATTAIQRYGTIWMAFFALTPFITVGSSALARRHPHIRMTKTTDKFGEGSMRVKVGIVLVSGFLLSLGAWYRAATILAPRRPVMLETHADDPALKPSYLSKACFYIFNFTLEIIVCVLWLALRVDRRFHTPDGAKGAFSYAGGFVFAGEAGNEKKRPSTIQDVQRESTRSDNPHRGSRISIIPIQSREEKLEAKENRVSWGGVSPDAVKTILSEDRQREIPYPAVIEGATVDDIGYDAESGAVREMGWDPKSGKWAVRPIVGTSERTSRPVSMISSAAA